MKKKKSSKKEKLDSKQKLWWKKHTIKYQESRKALEKRQLENLRKMLRYIRI